MGKTEAAKAKHQKSKPNKQSHVYMVIVVFNLFGIWKKSLLINWYIWFLCNFRLIEVEFASYSINMEVWVYLFVIDRVYVLLLYLILCFCWFTLMWQAKKHGKQGDIADFRAQLDTLGLKIIQVTADGNCFFRFVLSKIALFYLLVDLPARLAMKIFLFFFRSSTCLAIKFKRKKNHLNVIFAVFNAKGGFLSITFWNSM